MKFEFKTSFFLVLLFLFDHDNIFFLAYLFIFIHELTHILTSNLFGLRARKIIFNIHGLKAEITNFNLLASSKKFVILISGPLMNLFIAIIYKFIIKDFPLAKINLYIFLFNLVPIYPLDGGRILILALKKFYPLDINKNKLFIRLNRLMIFILFIMGIAQFIFFMPNFSLLIVSIYLWYLNKILFVDLIYELYF